MSREIDQKAVLLRSRSSWADAYVFYSAKYETRMAKNRGGSWLTYDLGLCPPRLTSFVPTSSGLQVNGNDGGGDKGGLISVPVFFSLS